MTACFLNERAISFNANMTEERWDTQCKIYTYLNATAKWKCMKDRNYLTDGETLSTQPHRRQPIVLYRWRRTGQRKNFSRLKDRMARAVTDWIDTNKIVIWFIVIFSLSSMHTKHNSATQLKENALLYITPNELLSFFTTNCRKIVLHGALFRCR